MKNFEEYLNFKESKDLVIGGLADKKTESDLADKHNVSIDVIKAALKKGQKVEMEHTSDPNLAYEIAKDHIFEDPKYYDKLSTIEGFMYEATDYEFDPNEANERLKKREEMNLKRYRAAQDRVDNYAIKLYEIRMKIDKLDREKLKHQKAIFDLKRKYGKDK